MPIKHALWTVGVNPTPLRISRLASEQLLEEMIEKNLSILSDKIAQIYQRYSNGGSLSEAFKDRFV